MPASHCNSKRIPHARRRGMALLVVLGLVSMTLALAYAMMRGQASTAMVQHNATLRGDARQAALAGLARAMNRMTKSDWEGVAATHTGNVTSHDSYVVSYATGDSQLTEASPDLAEFPFRVTVTSVGTAVDPGDSNRRSTHTAKVVLQLVRRNFTTAASGMSSVQNYNVYQWSSNTTSIETPARLEGPVWMQGPLTLCGSYPSGAAPRDRYLADLEAMRAVGQSDWRPFSGPVSTPNTVNASFVTNTLQALLNVATVNIGVNTANPLPISSTPTSYRLYAGGKSYTIPSLYTLYGGTITNATVQGNVKSNPLGIFRTGAASVEVCDGATVQGTILTGSSQSILICGTNVNWTVPNLPALVDDATVRQLPAAVSRDDIEVHEQATVTLSGMCIAQDRFRVEAGSANAQLTLQGRLVAARMEVLGRWPWQEVTNWQTLYDAFLAQYNDTGNPSRVLHFPAWLKNYSNLSSHPRIQVRAPASSVTYHWQDLSQPVYAAHPNDGGLRWDLVRWEDGQP